MQIKFHLCGKEINLTSEDVTVVSDNLTIDKRGNITIKDEGLSSPSLSILDSTENRMRVSSSGIEITPPDVAVYPNKNISLKESSEACHLTMQHHNFGSVTYTAQIFVNGASAKLWLTNLTDSTTVNHNGITTSGVVTASNYSTTSDKRLKTDIDIIDDEIVNIIKEIEIKQFKIKNRNGLISFGIIAQDLLEIFKKYNKNPFDYEIIQEVHYNENNDEVYYSISYDQFLVLKVKSQELEIEKIKQKDLEKNIIIENLIQRIQKLEEKFQQEGS